MNTPPFGIPVWARDLHRELQEHTAEDRRLFEAVKTGQTELQLETGRQTVMLVEIQRDLAERRALDHRRAETEIELSGKTRGWIRKGLLGLLFVVLGWLLHRAGIG